MREASILVFCLAVFAAPISAYTEPAPLTVCYNFGCKSKGLVQPTADDIRSLGELFAKVDSARQERAQIRLAVAKLEQIAARELPTGNDIGGNYTEGMIEEGKQDCIDESINATSYLLFFARHGWLRWHNVEERVHRAPYLFDDHWAAQIRQRDTQQLFVVDSWLYDNGQPPIIQTLGDWQSKRAIRD